LDGPSKVGSVSRFAAEAAFYADQLRKFAPPAVSMGRLRANEQRLSDAEARLIEGTAVHGVR